MKIYKPLRTLIVAWTCLGLALPQIGHANDSSAATLQIPISKKVSDIALSPEGLLRGAVVDGNGRPIQNAPIVVGQNGKAIAKLRTDNEGQFVAKGLTQGMYQVVSHGGAHNYRVWYHDGAPVQSKRGVIHVANPHVARGAGYGPLITILSNPFFLALLVAAAIAIPLAAEDDDAS